MELLTTKQGCHTQNYHTEQEIGILSTQWMQKMKKKATPKQLWDLELVYESDILSEMIRGINRRSGIKAIT
eukprot:11348473-Ditylum_brightwellii.AAC.1